MASGLLRFVFGAFVWAAVAAHAFAAAAQPPAKTPLPERNPLRGIETPKPPPAPPHPSQVETPGWTDAEIVAAKQICEERLKDVTIDFTPRPPVREGRCGAPYPIEVASIGAAPAVRIEPPATVTCAMAVALGRWLKETVQPAARQHLESPVARLRNVASYHCRNRYDAAESRISEHALANALDIAAFTTEGGATVAVQDHWGAKDDGEPEPPNGAADIPKKPPATGDFRSAGRKAAPLPARKPANRSAEPPHDKEAETTSEKAPEEKTPEEKATEEQATEEKESEKPEPPDPKSLFLRAVHAGACRFFGTVLGPNANAAHHDHFHLDAKERRNGNYCR